MIYMYTLPKMEATGFCETLIPIYLLHSVIISQCGNTVTVLQAPQHTKMKTCVPKEERGGDNLRCHSIPRLQTTRHSVGPSVTTTSGK